MAHECSILDLTGLVRRIRRPQLRFLPSLSARQRAAVHAVGERWGLPHSSSGEGAARHITLGPADAERAIDCNWPAAGDGGGGGGGGTGGSSSCGVNGSSSDSSPTDAQLIALIQQHLGIDASDAFAAGPPPGQAAAAAARLPAAWQGGSKAGKAQPGAKGLVSVEEFIAKVLPLLEMEREAEVAQVRHRRQLCMTWRRCAVPEQLSCAFVPGRCREWTAIAFERIAAMLVHEPCSYLPTHTCLPEPATPCNLSAAGRGGSGGRQPRKRGCQGARPAQPEADRRRGWPAWAHAANISEQQGGPFSWLGTLVC